MKLTGSSHLRAVLLALFVTFLWSTSWVIIKLGLADLPALPFAGLRYTLAFLVLLPVAARRGQLAALRRLDARSWGRLALLGVVYYTITQGTQFLALVTLPAVTVSLMLSFSAVVVALLGVWLLGEQPTLYQWLGTAVYLAGAVVYFTPLALPRGAAFGLAVAAVSVLATSLAAVLGRGINREGRLDPLAVTVASMGIGSVLLLGGGVASQGLPPLTLAHWLMIGWLAVVNSALAFTLWNRTLQTLSAFESNVINNTMLIQIALLAWLFLDEALTARQIGGMALAALGAVVVQLRARRAR